MGCLQGHWWLKGTGQSGNLKSVSLGSVLYVQSAELVDVSIMLTYVAIGREHLEKCYFNRTIPFKLVLDLNIYQSPRPDTSDLLKRFTLRNHQPFSGK